VINRRLRVRKRGHDEIAESKERKQQERKRRTPEEGTNLFKKSSRTGRSPSRSEEGNKSKEVDKEMKTMTRETRENTEGMREENKVPRM
jgi:hypothetical protein